MKKPTNLKPMTLKEKNKLKWIIYSSVMFVILWPVIGALINIDSWARCLIRSDGGNCASDTLSIVMQTTPIWVACFVIGYNLIAQYRDNMIARIAIALLFSVIFTRMAFHWYAIVLWGLS